jgi:dihydrofolate synthase/folylpolyglutamate synthase
MGGRLDSTNVCTPRVSVITSISFDHTRQLGTTLAEIAGEKAGIVKPGVPVVSGVAQEEPRQVIQRVCRQRGSRLIQAGIDFHYDYDPPQRRMSAADAEMDSVPRGTVDVKLPSARSTWHHLSKLELALLGRHQAANAAAAVAVFDELVQQGWRIEQSHVRAGLSSVKWPVRVELIGRAPLVVVDAAHNVASLAATFETVDEHFAAERRLLIFATTLEKDVRGMLKLAAPRFDRIVLTRYTSNPRGVPVAELEAIAGHLGARHCTICPDPTTAWREATSWAGRGDLIVASGSFFLAAEIRGLYAATISTQPTVSVSAGG